MKKVISILLFAGVFIISSCSGSETYRGLWKCTDKNGTHQDIVFGENDIQITKDKETKKYEYTQNSFEIKNSVEKYGIEIKDNGTFTLFFPIPGNQSKGVILDANGNAVYIISRTEYLNYDDLFGVN